MAAVLAAAALAVAALALPPRPVVVVRDQDRRVVAELPLPPSGRFELRYRHSVYRSPAAELFQADPGGDGFRLVAVASPDEAVLDYYGLEGRRAAMADGWRRLDLAAPQRFGRLPLVATATGRRTLAAGGRQVPLAGPGTPARHLELSVGARRLPR